MPLDTTGNAAPKPRGGRYYQKRRHMIYYHYLDRLVRGFGSDARSMLDVGSCNAPYMDAFDWISTRDSLDITTPYRSEHVRGIKADFFAFEPEQHYDLVTCFQVLEHIPDAQAFAQKLLAVGNGVLCSVPYKWPAGSHWDHPNDPVDETKIKSWFKKKPDYKIVVSEPFGGPKSRRLFCYFHVRGARKSLSELRGSARTTRTIEKSGDDVPVEEFVPPSFIERLRRGFRAFRD